VKRRRDLPLLLAALALIALSVVYTLYNSRGVEQRREAALAGVPQFPAPHQVPRRKPSPVVPMPRPPPVAAVPVPAKQQDPLTSFVLAQGSGAALIQVNALFNTPLMDRLRECLPEQFRALDTGGKRLGIDFTTDVDRVALAPDGVAMSGFFAGKPVAEMLGGGPGSSSEDYRGATIYDRNGRCVGQLGNLVVQGSDCRSLIDRALAPAPDGAADALYGDVYLRTDLSGFRTDDTPPQVRALVEGLDGLTLRANVWDSVALSLEGDPGGGRSPKELAQMAKGALALVKSQLGEDDVELQALADLAKVSAGDKLQLDLALPAKDLFERFRLPCPGRDAGSP